MRTAWNVRRTFSLPGLLPVTESHLTLEVVPQRGRPQPGVESRPDLLQLAAHLVRPREVEVALGGDLVQGAPVLRLQLAEYLLRALHRLLAYKENIFTQINSYTYTPLLPSIR